MLTSLTNKDGLTLRSAYKDAINAALRSADFTTLKHEFSKLLNELSYESTAMFTEAGFRNIYKIMLQILGFYVWTEYQTAMGRCDLCFEGQGRLYVIELKIAPDRSKVPECLQQAATQIRKKKYAVSLQQPLTALAMVIINQSKKTGTNAQVRVAELQPVSCSTGN